MMRSRLILAAAMLCLTAIPAVAEEFKAGDLTIDQPWSRATPKGALVGVGYLVIHNHGAAPDRLVGASADIAGAVAIHEMTMDNGVMRMREMKSGLEIPANGQVALAPKGDHLMFTDLKRPLRKGDSVKATLVFEHAGSIPVTFEVGGVGAAGSGAAAKPEGAMKGMKM